MTKPADFYLGVVEFFAVLLPGAALTYLLLPFVMASAPTSWLPAGATQGWAIFLVAAYVAGHVLHGLGSWLLDDYVYGNFYLPRWRASHRRTSKFIAKGDRTGLREDKEAAASLLARVYLETAANPRGTNFYDWCLSDIRMNAPAGAGEVDRLQADSKFFRSMAIVFLAAGFISAWEGSLFWVAGATLLTLFAVWRFCKLRWTATKRVYEYYLLSRDRKEERD